jgi:hypothetical protein
MRNRKEGATNDLAKGSLQIRAYKGRPFYEARWRDRDRVDRRKRLGPAWVEADGKGGWRPRRGRVPVGQLDERQAFRLMDEVIAEHEERLSHGTAEKREALFEDAATAWLEHLRTERRAKPSTLRNYELLLREPSGDRRQRGARIMRAFGGMHLFRIATKDVRVFLAELDREDLAPRTLNIHRQVLHAIFEFARREESFGLPHNPVAGTAKRPEEGVRPVETFEPPEIRAIAAAATSRTPRSSSSPRPPDCVWVSWARCAGETSASRVATSRSRGRSRPGRSRAPSLGARVLCRWPVRRRRSSGRCGSGCTSPAATTTSSAVRTVNRLTARR